MMLLGFALVGGSLLHGGLEAQEALAPDRPGLDFSPAALDPGAVQMELGPLVSFADGADLFTVPTLVRVGVVRGFELRAGVSPYNRSTVDAGPAVSGSAGESVTETGFGDLELGAKVELLDGSAGGPALALIPSVTVPTGDAGFTSDGVGYLLNAVAGFPLAERTGLAVVGGLYFTKNTDEHDAAGLAGLVLARSLSDRVSAFVEWGILPTEKARDGMLAGAGLTFLATPDVQLDVFVDRGLTNATPDWQVGAGAAIRP